MNAEQWLTELAAELRIDPPSVEQIDALLELAAVAAHTSERTAAPISCWLAAMAMVPPAQALEVARLVAARHAA